MRAGELPFIIPANHRIAGKSQRAIRESSFVDRGHLRQIAQFKLPYYYFAVWHAKFTFAMMSSAWASDK